LETRAGGVTYLNGDNDLDRIGEISCPVTPDIQVAKREFGRIHDVTWWRDMKRRWGKVKYKSEKWKEHGRSISHRLPIKPR
jgi:hypothetical protein